MTEVVKKEEGSGPSLAATEPDSTTTTTSTPSLTVENFREAALNVLSQELKKWNGPAQYLREKYASEEAQKVFQEKLDDYFPPRPELTYHSSLTLPEDLSVRFHLKLSDLGFSAQSSTKAAPLLVTSLLLLDEFVTHSVLTAEDPVQLCQGPTQPDAEARFWSRFVKGSARSCTLLFLASEIMGHGWNLQVLNPELLRSMTAITARRGLMTTDLQSVALENARLSVRGAIRRAPCMLTWLGILGLLQHQGLSAEAVVKAWNSNTTGAGALVGSKRTAVLAVLKWSDECQQLLLTHLSTFSDNTAFLEDSFANPRLKLGYKPRAGAKVWNDRLTVTAAGQLLMLRNLHEKHQKRLPGCQRKLPKETLEEALNMAQLLLSLAQEVTAQTPIASEVLEKEVYQHWVNGDPGLDMELQGSLAEKSANFRPSDISVFKALIQRHVSDAEKRQQALGLTGPSIQAAELDRQSYDLACSQIQHDLNVFKVWLTRSRDREAAVYFQELAHAQSRKKQAGEIARSLMDRGSAAWRIEFHTLATATECHAQVQSMKNQLVRMENLSGPEAVFTVVFLNWAAPSTYTAAQQACQTEVAGCCINGDGNCFGAVLTPVYFHRKGVLFKLEEACNKYLAGANLNTDQRFALCFSGKTDEREKRTLVQPGRFMLSMDDETHKKAMTNFRNVPLMRKPITEEATLLPTRDLVVIEDLSPDSLPNTTDLQTSINPPEKHQQLGVDAARKYLRGITQNLAGNGRFAVFVVDLSCHTTEMCKAVQLEAPQAHVPMYYMGFAADSNKLDWAQQHVETWLSEEFLNQGVPLPSSTVLPPKALPSDQCEAAPPQPQLSVLAWCNRVKFEGLPSLKTPDSLLVKYWDDQRFGSEFQNFLRTAREELPLDLKEEKAGPAGSGVGQKRKSSVAGPANPPMSHADAKPKRARAGEAEAEGQGGGPSDQLAKPIGLDQLPSALHWEAVTVTNKHIAVVVAVNQRIFLVNRSSETQALPTGTVIAGWFKGKFWQHRDGGDGAGDGKRRKSTDSAGSANDPSDADVLFQLDNADSLVSSEGKLVSVGSLLTEKRKAAPDAKIAYHELTEAPKPGQPAFFQLSLKFHIYFRAENVPTKTAENDETPKISQGHLAGCLKATDWETSATSVFWAVKWSPSAGKGLTPVRPMVLLKVPVQLPPQSALELTASAAGADEGTLAGAAN